MKTVSRSKSVRSLRPKSSKPAALSPSPTFPQAKFFGIGSAVFMPEGVLDFQLIGVTTMPKRRGVSRKNEKLVPLAFRPMESDRRFRIAYTTFEDASLSYGHYLENPDGEKAWLQQMEARRRSGKPSTLPPVSYLDVSPSGDAQSDCDYWEFQTREAALRRVAKLNRESVKEFGRGIVDRDGGKWYVVVEYGRPIVSLRNIDVYQGAGTARESVDFPTRLVVPTDAERAKHLIDWSKMVDVSKAARGKGGAA